MNVSVAWLSDLLDLRLDAAEAAERIARLAVPVDEVEPVYPDLDGVVVGLVEEVGPHPNADRLTLCRVQTGADVVDVVCGAPNVTAGRKYPYAPAGVVLPGGLKLTARKIRGIASNGMLCSARELQLGADHEGIMELATEAAPGTPLPEAIPLEDYRLVLDVTANRPDLLCHRGVARELGAAYGRPVKLPLIPDAPPVGDGPRTTGSPGTVDGIEVLVEDVEGCPRYMAAVIRGLRIGPSPDWLQRRLHGIGARPINNVVDATNYILFELNQPMHAFDAAGLRGNRIVVRRARDGELLTTLDGEKRTLSSDMTMICDGDGPVAVGGVMGGADSEVTADTTDVLLECAYFDPKRIRRTRKLLKMTTDASYRYERGTDLEGMGDALRRAVQLIRAVAGGEEREAGVDVWPEPQRPRTVFLRPARVAHLLGVPIPDGAIERHLVSVGFGVAPKRGRFHVQVPGWRPDVTREVDLIEEVARLQGYDTFPVEMRPFRPSTVPDDPVEPLKARLRRVLASSGLHEARANPLVPQGGAEACPVLNPLSADGAYLREALLPELVRAVERNWAVRERDVRLFEVGNVFRKGATRPVETLRVAGVVTGARLPPHWSSAADTADYERWDVAGLFEDAVRVAVPGGRVVPSEEGWTCLDGADRACGRAGPLAADRPAWAAPLFGFELDVTIGPRAGVTYAAVPTTPPVERDVSLVLPEGVEAGQVEAAMSEAAGPLLESATVFDEYRGGAGGRSVAWRLIFRAPDRTLRDKDADRAVERALRTVKERFGVERRKA